MNAHRWLNNVYRADFLSSVGLYITREHLVLVRLRKNLLRVSLVEQEARELPRVENRQELSELTGWVTEDVREIALKAESESRERALRQALVSLLPHFSAARDAVYICVAQDQAIVQPIFLPLAAQENLQQVLEYEIERQLPFRRDEIFYDYLPMGKQGDKIALYLFAIPKSNLAGLLDVLDSFGIKPSGVETTATALANYLLFARGEEGDLAAVIGGHDQTLELIGVQSKSDGWKPTHEMLFSHWIPSPDWAQGAARELLNDCLGRAPKLYGWGEIGESLRAMDGSPLEYEDLVAVGNEKLKGGKEILHPYVLPAIGAGLRGLRETFFTTNFLRHEGAESGRGKTLSIINSVLAALLLIALISWGASYPIKDELRLRQLQAENKKLGPSVEALRREETELQKVRKEVKFLSDIEQRRGELLRVLDELSKSVPTNAYFSNLRYRAGLLEVQGNAENASALIPLLERSPLFENVGFNAPSNRGRDNRETFSLKADIEKPKEKATKP